MKENTKKTLRKWAAKIKQDIQDHDETWSLDQLEKFMEKEDFDGIIDELRKMRKKRRKLNKTH
jgi:protein subunit release factor A